MRMLIFLAVAAAAFAAHPVTASAQTIVGATSRGSSTQPQSIRNENAQLKNENAQLKKEIAALRKQLRLQKESLAKKAILETAADANVSAKTARETSHRQVSTSTRTTVSPAAASTYAAYISTVHKATSAVVTESGYHAWVDGIYERVHLPSYGLGVHSVDIFPNPDIGVLQNFDPRVNSGGVRGAIGYRVPGSPFELEIGGSYLEGTGSLSQDIANPSFAAGVILLNGSSPLALSCGGIFSGCIVNGTLNSQYSEWRLSGKAGYDLTFGPVTVAPSAALFGGSSHADQRLTQAFTQVGGASANYTANTSLRWTEVGVRVGLDANIAVNDMFIVGLGGWVGLAGRNTSLSGNDVLISTFPGTNGASTITASDTARAFSANLEAGFAHTLTPSIVFRGFAGVNYDNKVPGIKTGTFGSVFAAQVPIQASIYYARETDYYAGAGLDVKFGG